MLFFEDCGNILILSVTVLSNMGSDLNLFGEVECGNPE